MNKTNKILIGSVSALCIVGTLILLKAVFPGAEYGSVSDWVSAGSTFGTLIVALIALKKAPDWINQKKHEDGYELAKKLIVYEYPEIMTTISKYNGHLEIINRKRKGDEVIIAILNNQITTFDCDLLLNLFNNANITPLSTEQTIKQLIRFNWVLKNEVLISAKSIRSDYESIQIISHIVWNEVKKRLQENSNLFIDENLEQALIKLKGSIEELQRTLKEFEEYDTDFEKYFDKPSTKK